MPPIERDAPRDLDRALKHQHSASSDHGRALIPMWDSSDPERAPPPLPLNPQSPSVASRAGTSIAIQSAHAALQEKARENAMVPHLTKRMTETSPERSLFKGSTHRRMQSLQPASVKDLSLMIEGGRDSSVPAPRSPEKTDRPSRPSTPGPSRGRDPFAEPRDRDRDDRDDRDDRALVASPRPGPSLTPIIRPTVRRPHSSILGENTPPQSATMMALHNMSTQSSGPPPPKEPETPLANITNGSTALVKAPALDQLSNQILSLTNIATALQKEMSQLSRRSRDNATDLVSLKEATNARDEDIRRSLRELISDAKARTMTRDPYGGPLLLEGRGLPTSPTQSKVRAFALPRIPSPNSFAASLDRESLLSTPSLCADSPAAVVLLEKILRDMGTREGQDTLLSRLTALSEKLAGNAIADKVEEILRMVRSNQNHAIVPAAGGRGGGGDGGGRNRGWSVSEDDDDEPHRRDLDYTPAGPMTSRVGRLLQENDARRSSAPQAAQAADVVNEEVIKVIKSVKDSVAQGGGLTAELKALVRDLRGEVLGMGREIGRRLDEVAAKNISKGDGDGGSKAEMSKVVEEGLAELKQHMNNLLREHRRQSVATTASKDTAVDYKEIYNSMRAALKDSQANKPRVPELRREDVMQAVKDAWEKYKPEIEIQQIGLERDEVLACLQEGLRAYAPPDDKPPAATRDEVFQAVLEGLKHFTPPRVEIPPSLSRDEILEAVRECLEEFEFPVAASAIGAEISKDDMLDAVKEGLHSFDFPAPPSPPPRGPDLSKDDVLDAVNEGLHSFDFLGTYSSALVQPTVSKGDVADAVREGLDAYGSALVPQSISKTEVEEAVNGGLESFDFPAIVLDATKEGLEAFDFPAIVLDATKEALDMFDFSSIYSSALVPQSVSKGDMLESVKEGLQSFDFSRLGPQSELSREDVLAAVKEGLQSMDFSAAYSSALVPATSNNDEIAQQLEQIKDLLHAEFKAVSDEAKQNVAANGRDTEQVLDATKDGLEKLRLDIETYVDRAMGVTGQEEFMANLAHNLDGFRDEVKELVARSSDTSKEVLQNEIESLREAVNSSLVPITPQAGNHKEIIEALQEGISSLRTDISTRPIPGIADLLDAMHEGLGSLRIDIDKLYNKPPDLTGNDEILEALKTGFDSLREESKNDRALTPYNDGAVISTEQMVKADDIKNLEVLITQLGSKVEAMESMPPPPPAAPAVDTISKEDLAEMEEMLRNVKESVIDVKESVTELSSREPPAAAAAVPPAAAPAAAPAPASTDAASREDVQAIETILRNTKGRLDDLIDGEQAVRKDHVDALETLILETRESLGGLSSQLEAVSRKEDVTVVESIVTQIIASFDEMKERQEKALEDPEKVTKTDVEAVEAVCLDMKSVIDEMKERYEKALEDPEKVTKTDVEAVEAVCLDMKSVIDQMVKADLASLPSKEDLHNLESMLQEVKDRMDLQADNNSKAFEERQAEIVGVSERVTEVKAFLEEFQGTLKGKLEDGAKGIDAINRLLDTMSDILTKNANVGDDLKDMFETMKMEFEESRAGVVGAKLEADEKFQITTDTLTTKLDERIAELFGKYDDFQLLQEDRAAKGEARDIEMEAAVVGTKAIADELKVLVDTLGTAVTDSLEKMEEASKTVFTRVEELVNKSDENHSETKVEHQLTRDQIKETLDKVEGLQGQVGEYQPQILETIKEVLQVVGQHYEHSKTVVETIQETIEENKPPELLLPPPPEKYDDSGVHEKLDKLVEHTETAEKAYAQLETLDKVHQQVIVTAAEITQFLADQTQRIADEHEDREKTLQDTVIALERRLQEKEQVEATVAELREEESRLKEAIHVTLKEEQEQLKEAWLTNLREEETRLREVNLALQDEQKELKESFLAGLAEEELRLKEANEALREEQKTIKEAFVTILSEEEFRLKEANTALREEQDRLKEAFIANLQEEELRLKEANVALTDANLALKEEQEKQTAAFKEEQEALKVAFKEEQETLKTTLKEEHEALKTTRKEEHEALQTALKEEHEALQMSLKEEHETLKTTLKEEHEALKAAMKEEQDKLKEEFLANLKEEEERLKAANDTLREEQQRLKDDFLANLKEEGDRLKELNASLKEEHERLKEEQNLLKETFLASLKEEEARLRESNDSLREEQTLLKDTFLANLKDEEARLKEVNVTLAEEQERLKEGFMANLKDEETRLKEMNASLKEEHDRLREEQEQLKEDWLANLRVEEARLREVNATLLEEQALLKEGFLATLREEDERLKDSLRELRGEQESLTRQKVRLSADVSSLDTALRLRREELHDMEARAEGLERRILEGVMDHSRVLLMAKTNRMNGREAMSRKRVSSQKLPTESATATPTNGTSRAATPKPRTSATNIVLSGNRKVVTPKDAGTSRRILSLSQITNNVPTGGLKRSQSVRTAAGPGRRKSDWAGGNRVPAGGSKGYGDLGKEDKENIELKESDEYDEHDHDRGVDDFATPEPVDIIPDADPDDLDEPIEHEPVEHEAGEEHHEEPHEEHDEEDHHEEDLPEFDGHDEEDAEALRRASRGTTVITSTENYEDEYPDENTGEYDDAHPEFDEHGDDGADARSDWTASPPPESALETEESIAEDELVE
ncbi:hypothetical protein QBC46DRAFT_440793 [Diplogelasinospora grovesii]|uniref:Transport protein USO1 n=1 Tax=Diplogelasinospora grovesii TaxID=303347 RepID=A0AAN6NGM2_9PEZI|nr:hypothetical protein QBC46DRAFT_440793 [Diplogelasinospora grovesii]